MVPLRYFDREYWCVLYTDDQANGSAPDGRKVRKPNFKWFAARILRLLHAAEDTEVYSLDGRSVEEKWTAVSESFLDVPQDPLGRDALPLHRSCQDKVQSLLAIFQADSKAKLWSSGTEEEVNEMSELCARLLEVRSGWQHFPVPGVSSFSRVLQLFGALFFLNLPIDRCFVLGCRCSCATPSKSSRRTRSRPVTPRYRFATGRRPLVAFSRSVTAGCSFEWRNVDPQAGAAVGHADAFDRSRHCRDRG